MVSSGVNPWVVEIPLSITKMMAGISTRRVPGPNDRLCFISGDRIKTSAMPENTTAYLAFIGKPGSLGGYPAIVSSTKTMAATMKTGLLTASDNRITAASLKTRIVPVEGKKVMTRRIPRTMAEYFCHFLQSFDCCGFVPRALLSKRDSPVTRST